MRVSAIKCILIKNSASASTNTNVSCVILRSRGRFASTRSPTKAARLLMQKKCLAYIFTNQGDLLREVTLRDEPMEIVLLLSSLSCNNRIFNRFFLSPYNLA